MIASGNATARVRNLAALATCLRTVPSARWWENIGQFVRAQRAQRRSLRPWAWAGIVNSAALVTLVGWLADEGCFRTCLGRCGRSAWQRSVACAPSKVQDAMMNRLFSQESVPRSCSEQCRAGSNRRTCKTKGCESGVEPLSGGALDFCVLL